MASQANVYTTVSAQAWYTDKALISTGNTSVTYNVALYPGFSDTIYSNAVVVPANSFEYVYVGVGNKLTVTGANFTASEAGTASSGTAGVSGLGSYVGQTS
jgi:hypothetical protein